MNIINKKIISYFKNSKKNVKITSLNKNKNIKYLFLKKHEIFWNLKLKKLINSLLKKRLHLGQHKSKLNPTIIPYIYGIKNNFCIIDIKKTIRQLQNALKIIYYIGTKDYSSFLIIGTTLGVQNMVKDVSNQYNFNYVNGDSWISGLITNTKSLKRAAILEQNNEKKISKYLNFVQPDILIILNPQDNLDAINEANIKSIPIIAFVDTHCSIKNIDYPIIMNNESLDGVFFVLRMLCHAFNQGREYKEQSNILNKNIKN